MKKSQEAEPRTLGDNMWPETKAINDVQGESMRDTNTNNPRLQCEHCGKWRRLITNGDQCMFYWAPEHEGFVGDRVYQNICIWCIDKVQQQHKLKEDQPS